MTKDEAWAEAERVNLELGRKGEKKRYAVAVEGPDGGWIVEITSEQPKGSISDALFGGFLGSGGPG